MYIWAKLHLFVLLLYVDDKKIDNEYDQNDHYDNSNDNNDNNINNINN